MSLERTLPLACGVIDDCEKLAVMPCGRSATPSAVGLLYWSMLVSTT
ncbi:hypothetical protein [Lysobacter gummosus]